jgi:hypothetical protein
MLVKCQRCYGSNHYEQDCISSQLAGLNQIRPKCNFCRGWGHSVDHCPSSRRRTDGSNTPTQLQCLRCQGRLHPETRCTSPTDAGLLKIHPRCTQCEGWGHTPPRCPMTLTSSVVASQPTPPKETVDADVALRAQYLWSLRCVFRCSNCVWNETYHFLSLAMR